MFEVNLLAVLIAALVNIGVGMLWYSSKMFGVSWMRMVGLTPEHAEMGKKKMPLHAFYGFLSAFVMAYVLNHFGIAWGVFDWIGAMELAFWVWLGFQVPLLIGPALWEMRPWKLVAINAGYWFLTLNLASLILIWFAV